VFNKEHCSRKKKHLKTNFVFLVIRVIIRIKKNKKRGVLNVLKNQDFWGIFSRRGEK